MLSFKSVNGQSYYDICLNTYGSLDFMSKLLLDNGISDIESQVPTSKVWVWDETLNVDQAINQQATSGNIVYATSASITGSVLGIIVNDNNSAINIGAGDYINSNPITTYQKFMEVQYIATGGETSVILSVLIGADIVHIIREIESLKTSEYNFIKSTGTLTLLGDAMIAGETLYIIYTKLA